MNSRRDVLKAAAVSLALTPTLASLAAPILARKSLRILILGGTGFLGPAVVDAALKRGHSLTLFNRGRREKLVGAPDRTEKLYGNRDPDKHAQTTTIDGKEADDTASPKGLDELKGKSWDAVVDTSGYVPRIVNASASLLAQSVAQYVFISTLSVYARNDRPGLDESDELAPIADPSVESMGARFENYGPLKALCEQAAEKAMPGRVTNIRPGYIVGPLDTTDRFTYWPVRVSKGGNVLVPGAPDDPFQFIDVRDLADFIIRCIENKTVGVFNATGPTPPASNASLMAACLDASKSLGLAKDATFTYAAYETLAPLGAPPGTFPILLPAQGDYAGFHRRSIAKASAAGLTHRPPADTCKAILEWWPKALELRAKVDAQLREEAAAKGRPAPPPLPANPLRAGPTQDDETRWLAALAKDQR
ncbi:MAG: NAD-dependent epimerase/dehydratase family protein [Phycisphaeraceae bacterium]|nr:MAG: NAD-dependent epimerase/dehydratase family protein [Phycisphaeraceae bacterium]